MAKHTKGPWRIEVAERESDDWAFIYGVNHKWIGTIKCEKDEDENEAEANANLFISVSDLLEACEKIKSICATGAGIADRLSTIEFCYATARAAISKAKGEP